VEPRHDMRCAAENSLASVQFIRSSPLSELVYIKEDFAAAERDGRGLYEFSSVVLLRESPYH